ncbi:hypothetical protein N836_13635 [Leptolyngbya sp. Heron Island J]|uniref:hypothetical protein n=1 Tax=Leptolyngbya sp. Heron Island J TaxID=1385935 RepID=UPI0003B9F109|nr:hypothetical protein [Leptolyngbya sp. Heron Island J]ESA35102.1 hypothetical protein N836_13635 [Leptolyngbya sp. Heron Island J]
MVRTVTKRNKKGLIGYFTHETATKLEQLAKEGDRSISYVITKLVEAQLRQKEKEEKESDDNN